MNFWKKLLAAATAGMLCLGSVAIANRTNGNVTMHTAADEPAEGAYDGMYGDLYYQINADNEIAIVGCEANATSAIIPEKIGGKSVTRIEASTFDSYANLKSVSIPSSMKVIEDMAFYRCVNLNRVYISDLSSWCSIDFANATSNPLCNGAELYVDGEWTDQLTLPDDVTEINDFAFCGFSGLKQIEIPNGVTSIGDYAFKDCSGLTAVELPQGVERIGRDAFLSCTGLTKIVIPNSVNDIGRDAFGDCSALTIYGNSGSYAQEYAERYDIPFVSVAGETTTAITTTTTTTTVTTTTTREFTTTTGTRSFFYLSIVNRNPSLYYCFWNECADLRTETFYGDEDVYVGVCSKDMVSVEIDPDVTVRVNYNNEYSCEVVGIQDDAFQGCTKLTSLTIPDSVKYIPEGVFDDCPNLTIYGNAGSYAQKYAESHNISFVATSSQVTTTTTETTTTTITTMTTTTATDAVTHVLFTLADDEPPLSFRFSDGNQRIEYREDVTVYVWTCEKDAEHVEIPSKVQYDLCLIDGSIMASYDIDVYGIQKNAFQGCTNLTQLTIPNCVKDIPENAFEDCPNLTIYGNAGSYAQEYAENYGIPFVILGSENTTTIMATTTTTTTTTTKTTTTALPAGTLIYGDINLDGRVDITDAVLLNKYCSGSVSLNKDAAKNADCDGDKEISSRDAISLLKFLVQLIPALPESE